MNATMFIDAAYEGDLMAMAGERYRIGREGRSEYGEGLAPSRPDGELQAYNFRLTMTRDPKLRVPIARPDGFRADDFAEILPLLASGRFEGVFCERKSCIYKVQRPSMPNGKFDINDMSHGQVRLSLPGANLGWPFPTPLTICWCPSLCQPPTWGSRHCAWSRSGRSWVRPRGSQPTLLLKQNHQCKSTTSRLSSGSCTLTARPRPT